jgi:hypothetical protein
VCSHGVGHARVDERHHALSHAAVSVAQQAAAVCCKRVLQAGVEEPQHLGHQALQLVVVVVVVGGDGVCQRDARL